MKSPPDPHYRHRFPAEIISHAVWLYHVFSLSLRDVELLLAERGIVVSYETVRRWCRKFGQSFADCLRRRRPRPGDKWHLDGVSRTHPQRKEVWSCMRDGGRSPEAGSQVQASNHCKLRPSKATVVSVAAKGGTRSRQVWSGEASESEPLMTCRNSMGDVKTGGAIFFRDQLGGGPEVCPSGIRHIGGAKPDQALIWNVRTCRLDAKGEAQVGKTARA